MSWVQYVARQYGFYLLADEKRKTLEYERKECKEQKLRGKL